MTVRTFTIGLATVGVGALLYAAPVRAGGSGEDLDAKFQMMDTNGDGKISAEEHAAGAKTMFEKMDTNGDGKVTAAEMETAHEKMMGGKGGKMKMSASEKIKMIDTNKDGVLTEEEHAAGARTMFDKMDADHDGYITKAEMKAGHEKMMGKAHGK